MKSKDAGIKVSAGVVLVLKPAHGSEPKVVLIKQNNSHYGRPAGYGEVIDIGPKGGVENGESEPETALREAAEEVGLTGLSLDKSFKTEVKFEFDQPTGNGAPMHIRKKVVYYLAYITEEEAGRIRLSEEHESFEILPISSAVRRIEASAKTKMDVLNKIRFYVAKTAGPG